MAILSSLSFKSAKDCFDLLQSSFSMAYTTKSYTLDL